MPFYFVCLSSETFVAWKEETLRRTSSLPTRQRQKKHSSGVVASQDYHTGLSRHRTSASEPSPNLRPERVVWAIKHLRSFSLPGPLPWCIFTNHQALEHLPRAADLSLLLLQPVARSRVLLQAERSTLTNGVNQSCCLARGSLAI